ncbi:flagellar basal body protein [Paracidovorax wautersii]|uniref:Flagellar hook protein FlgE n=1 Tax=Paracidovorax wautersii TaxID=1177982 RepID=A0ABU1I909_9BURK|nr:flagellar basal body protein [Paracidovorax wautersii]MDR6213697.1 flagellar hook protein FlgE [Paracidovorax wautersii]
MSSIGSIASSGLRAAQLQLDSAAHNVANAATPGFRRQEAELQSEADQSGVRAQAVRAQQEGAALEADAVNQIASTYSFAANLQMLRTEDRMMGALINTKA